MYFNQVIIMRMRNKPWAKPELEACDYFISEPLKMRGQWAGVFKRKNPVYIELGCGKGGFAAQAATENTDINYIAVDLEYKMLGVARRKISKMYEEKGLTADNILLVACNIENIGSVFSDDELIADRIYINFCNPWPKKKHKKHRLTHPRQLIQYRRFLKDDGEIYFKTDDDELFEESIEYFKECGFDVSYKTYDLHSSGFEPNIVSEHEKMFSDEGIKIKFLIAKKTGQLESDIIEKK